MQRIRIYEDAVNYESKGKSQPKNKKRQALGEVSNTIITRSKYIELNEGLKRIQIKDKLQYKPRRATLKKLTVKKAEHEDETNKSPRVKRKRRLSSVFRVSEYANDIYKYLQEVEDKYPICKNMRMDNMFRGDTRFALVDWLVQICENFQCVHETLQLCVAIVDRYVQQQDALKREDLESIGLAAVFIASKYEELQPIDLMDLLQVCCSASSTADILKMEMKIVSTMQGRFGRPVPAHFLRRYCRVARATAVQEYCAFYLTDVALMSSILAYVKPSIVAASALFTALCVTNGAVDGRLWDTTLNKYSTYQMEDLEDCMKVLARCLKKTKCSRYRAIEEKYSKPIYFNVNQIPEFQTVMDALSM